MISKLLWGDAKPVPMEQFNANEGGVEVEEVVAQVDDLKNGEYVKMVE